MLTPVWQDVRYAVRSYRRSPGFTLVALVTLALGIGGTTAVFSVVDGVVFRPLPYPDSDRLVRVSHITAGQRDAGFSALDYLDLRHDSTTLSSFAGFREDIVDLTGRGDPVRVEGVQTTAAFFDALGAPPLLGRTYHEATDNPGAAVAVISEGLWRRQFGAAPTIVGTSIRLNGTPTEIVGVVGEEVRHPLKADLWMLSPHDVPISPVPQSDDKPNRDVGYFGVLARMAPGATNGAVIDELRRIGDRIAKEFPDTSAGESFTARPLAAWMVSDVRGGFLVLLGAAGCVLLVACANVAGLLLARGASRRRELAVRAALGAGRGRVIRQLITESLLLSLAGLALGIIVASWMLGGLVALAPDTIPRLADVEMDLRVGLFAFVLATVVGLVFGVAPALQSTAFGLNNALKDGGRTGTARTRVRSALVVLEVAVALVLLVGAGLLASSLLKLRAVDPGFRTTQLVAIELPLPQVRYNEAAQRRFYQGVLDRLHANPTTQHSAAVFPMPLRGSSAAASFRIEGQEGQQPKEPVAELNTISGDFFQIAGLQLLHGRTFDDRDGEQAPPVCVINRTLADHYLNGREPIGARINVGDWMTVVGVVSDSRRSSLDTAPQPAIYLPLQQLTLPFIGLVVRTPLAAGAVAAAVRSAVSELDRDLPIGEVQTIEQIIDASTGQPRFRTWLLAGFAALAVLLAGIGLYGLISFSVAQRIPEMGIRLALGATPSGVCRLVMREGLLLAATGVALGLAAALAATRVLQRLLFDTSATDPRIYAALATVLLITAALACYVPARRAMRTDPMTALRAE